MFKFEWGISTDGVANFKHKVVVLECMGILAEFSLPYENLINSFDSRVNVPVYSVEQRSAEL